MALSGTIEADFSDFVGEAKKAATALNEMETEARQTGAALDTELGKADKSTSQLTGTLTSLAGAFGIGFSINAVVGFGKEILQTADDLTRLSTQTGLTVEQVQRLSYTAEQSGNTLDQITTAASKMQVALDTEKGQKAVEALGIEFRQFAAAKPYDQLQQVNDALRGIEDPLKRVQLGTDLMGKSFAQILPTMVSDWREVGKAATLSSDEQIAALEAAGQAIENWGTAAKQIATATAGDLLLAGEQIADQGLLKTIQLFATSPSTAAFFATLANVRTAAKETAQVISDAEILAQGGFGPEPGETPADRAARERTEAAGKREHEQAARALATAEAELKQIRLGYGGLLATMNAETLKAVQADLQLGASQGTVATAYGLTAQQVKAAADQMKVQITVTTGLGTEWARVGEQVTITADAIVADIGKMHAATTAYEAETQRMVDEYIEGQYGIAAATDTTTASTQQLSVSMSNLRSTATSLFQEMQAGMALMNAYREAGVATGMQIATGGYTFQRQKRTLLPTEASTGNTLNVNVNSTDAQDIAGKLVTEMRRNGVRF